MSDRDAAEFSPVVEGLVGSVCERTLATNSIKLRFKTEDDPRGEAYIWIDPPWAFLEGDRLITTSDDYDDEDFAEWSQLFRPLDRTVFQEWRQAEDAGTVFMFSNGFRILVPEIDQPPFEDAWYVHWYAARRGA